MNVYVAVPTYNNHMHNGTCRSLLKATRRHTIHVPILNTSLLPQSFNGLWTRGLNHRRHPMYPADYFVMIHADVECMNLHWIDILVNLIEKYNADVVSTVIPLKDSRGVTSTAIGDKEDEWRINKRFTMKEVFNFPSTFCLEDTKEDGVLVVNTGLFIARIKSAWAEQILFHIASRNYKDENGDFGTETYPEDWNFSRQLHALGCKYYATRELTVKHHGDWEYSNDSPWGTLEHDNGSELAEYVIEGFDVPSKM